MPDGKSKGLQTDVKNSTHKLDLEGERDGRWRRGFTCREELVLHDLVHVGAGAGVRPQQLGDEVARLQGQLGRDVVFVLFDARVGVLQARRLKGGLAHQQCVPARTQPQRHGQARLETEGKHCVRHSQQS